jgi:hypothetical protein
MTASTGGNSTNLGDWAQQDAARWPPQIANAKATIRMMRDMTGSG